MAETVLGTAAAVIVAAAMLVSWWRLPRLAPVSRAWLALTAGVSTAGAAFISQQLLGVTPAPSAGTIEVLYAAGYLTTLAGLVGLARSGASTTSRILLLDAVAAACGAAVVVWQFVEPALADPAAADRTAAAAYMLADLTATVFVAHLVIRKPTNRAARWFLVFCGVTWLADTMWVIGAVGDSVYLLYPCGYAAFAFAVASPDAAELSDGEPETVDGPARIWTLGPALVALPAALFASALRAEPAPIAAAALAALASAAVLGRLSLLLTAHRAQTRELSQLAMLDQLTRLPNRRTLHERLESAASTSGASRVLLFVDLDDFKNVNDTFGHRHGDTVLVVTAERLRRVVREEDLVCRYAGDEFVIVCDEVDPALGVEGLVMRIREAIAAPVVVDGECVIVGAAIGAVTISAGHSPEQMLAAADARMYQDKRSVRQAGVAGAGGAGPGCPGPANRAGAAASSTSPIMSDVVGPS